ncbi:glycosyltransferase family 2 protein [Peribacillus frigoritolerans]|uniref:glycosyltransferase family 2 protein n=1 Tax=Peribacillus frigoritolerans TaxID=450367 RepID=UPI0039A213CC
MKVGVVLPVFNQEPQYIFECIQSLQNQTYRQFKLAIVIDGANVETVNAVYEASKVLTIPFQIINRTENQGIAYTLNEGFSYLTDCPYLTWVSSDNRHYPEFLQALVKTMDSTPKEIVLVYSLYHRINEKGINVSNSEEMHQFMTSLMRRPKEQIYSVCFLGASFLFRRQAFEKAGGYRNKFPIAQDHDFWMRILQHGDIYFLEKYLMEYRVNGKYSLTTLTPSENLILESMRSSIDNRKTIQDIPRVSVLLTSYNQCKYIDHAIESVLNQTFTNFHLIAVDDGSTDGTQEIIYQKKDSRLIELFLNHRGKAHALNAGLEFCLGEYVLELDGDDWLDPKTLEIMVREMDKQPPNVGLTYANRKLWNQVGEKLIEGPIIPGLDYRDKYDVLSNIQTHCPRLYRKSALKSIGGWKRFIDGQPAILDDFLMFLELAEKYDFHWINGALYHQRRHEKNITLIQQEEISSEIQQIVHAKIQEWGNEYIPEFIFNEGSLVKVDLRPRGLS